MAAYPRSPANFTAVNLDRRATATSQQDKKDAIEDHDLLITACDRIVSGFYLLARRPDLADRIRLALRPKSRTPSGEEPTGVRRAHFFFFSGRFL